MKIKNELINLGKLEENVSLKSHNTYKVEATTKYMFTPNDIDSLVKAIELIKNENIRYKILGKGSNLIFNFDNFDGIMIKLNNLNKCVIEDGIVDVESGYSLIKLAYEAAEKNLSGLEFASGIPGTIGGAVFMNAGAYLSDISAIFIDALVLTPDLEIKTLTKDDMNFGYRTSFIKETPGYIVLSSRFKLTPGDKEEITKIMNDRLEKRKSSQPLEYPSAGSVFRNPEGNFAGKLIEDENFKGYNINGAEVSTKHANFIINTGECTGKDIVQLINEIKTKIKDVYDIDLILEQEIVE